MRNPSATPSPQPRITLRDIALAVGVSTMTVSRALRHQPRISEALRATILAKAEELGYTPDPALSALSHYRRQRGDNAIKAELAWINPWRDPSQLRLFREFDLYWQGAVRTARRLGFRVEEFRTGGELSPARLATILSTRKIQGLLLPPGQLDEAWVNDFPWDRFSLVGLTRSHERLPVHEVMPDQVRNALLALARMEALGYRRIGFVSVPWQAKTFGAGILWHQNWLPAERRVPFCGLDLPDPGDNHARVRSWYIANRPDAILTDYHDLPALLSQIGLQVPRDVALATLTVLDCPIPAGIYQNPEEIGRVAVLTLASLINDHDCGLPALPRRTLIPGRWIDGPSLPRVS